MNLIFLGPPGVGKGTQASLICDHFSILHLSTGEMLRSEINKKSSIGKTAKSFIDQGELVPVILVQNWGTKCWVMPRMAGQHMMRWL